VDFGTIVIYLMVPEKKEMIPEIGGIMDSMFL
jgi:hypothetical protein